MSKKLNTGDFFMYLDELYEVLDVVEWEEAKHKIGYRVKNLSKPETSGIITTFSQILIDQATEINPEIPKLLYS